MVASWVFELVLLNCLHGWVSLAWIAGLRRRRAPLPPALEVDLLELGLLLPVVVLALRSVVPDGFGPVVRVELWSEAIRMKAPLLAYAFWALVAGTFCISGVQELPIILQSLRRSFRKAQASGGEREIRDQRLDDAMDELAKRRGVAASLGRAAVVSSEPFALVKGILKPRIVVSTALLERLSQRQLEAALAHELGHIELRGPLRMTFLWLVRVLQFHSPAALILFRSVVEARERECDEHAARIMARSGDGSGAVIAAIRELGEEPDDYLLRQRIRSLTERESYLAATGGEKWPLAAVLGGLLWVIR